MIRGSATVTRLSEMGPPVSWLGCCSGSGRGAGGNPDAGSDDDDTQSGKSRNQKPWAFSACLAKEKRALTDSTPEADACINTRTDADYMPVHLEKMDRIIGDAKQIRGYFPAVLLTVTMQMAVLM